jgi:uncharacterized membrane protein YdjX (TVP38/TMEM64 family)
LKVNFNVKDKLNPKFIVLVLALSLIFFSPLRESISLEKLTSTVESAKDMPSAPWIFILSYVLGVILALPGIAFMFLGGSLFGFWKGILLVIIASNIGCQFTFLISRFLGRDFISKFFNLNGFLRKISDKIDQNGFMVMLYLRLIPLFPFNLVNYASGLTNVTHRDYALGTFVGKLPAMFIYVYIASNFSDFENSKHKIPVYIAVFVIFTATTLLLEKKQKVFK